MAFFLAFLVLTSIILPAVTLSQPGRLGLSLVFGLALIFGALATIRHRFVICLVICLTACAFVVDLLAEFSPRAYLPILVTALKLCGLLILIYMTLKQTLRPGPVTVYRVIGGIAGYLLIGLTWAWAYQLIEQQIPGAVHFQPALPVNPARQVGHWIYFSFVTLTTVGYGDVQPINPVARTLAVAEALVGQLYIAILIASLVGMALQTKSVEHPATPEEPAALPRSRD